MTDDFTEATREVVRFANQAAVSTTQVDLSVISTALDELDAELGRQVLLPEADRPEGHAALAKDVRRVRALHRYRMTLG